MFKCTQCSSEFTRKDNLVVHQKKHDSVRFSCSICDKTFNDKSHRNRHMKNVYYTYILFNIVNRLISFHTELLFGGVFLYINIKL